MDRDDLATALFGAAEAMATRHGVRFGQGADADIQRFAQRGAEQILMSHPFVQPHDTVIAEAKLSFERLVVEMVSASLELPGYRIQSPGIIGEQTLMEALRRLCPLFPIC